jgi:hypothetical protein
MPISIARKNHKEKKEPRNVNKKDKSYKRKKKEEH